MNTATLRSDLDRLQKASVDAVSPTNALRFVLPENPPENGNPGDRIRLMANTPQGPLPMRVLDGAHRQIAEKTGIPWSYYDRMLNAEPDLLARNVNHWFDSEPSNRLLRTMLPLTEEEAAACDRVGAHYQVRAFLSDSYRPIDHAALFDTILPVAEQYGAEVIDYRLDEKHLHVRFATQDVDVLEQFLVEQPRLRGIQEVVSFGFAIRNSETGHGALWVDPSVKINRCTNVLIVTERMRVRHVGGRLDAKEDGFLQTDTKRLDDATTFLKVRDRVIEILGPTAREQAARQIAESVGDPIPVVMKVPVLEFVGNVGKRFDLTSAEVEVLQNEFLHEASQTGRMNRFSVSQAFTATARRLADEGRIDYDRRSEIESTGWKILESPVGKLLEMASAN